MHLLLFIHKTLFSSTCFEPQVLIFRRIQLYTCSVWYCHSLWEFLVACRYTAWVRTDWRGKVVGGCLKTHTNNLQVYLFFTLLLQDELLQLRSYIDLSTGWTPDESWLDSRQEIYLFLKASTPVLRPTCSPILRVPGTGCAFPGNKTAWAWRWLLNPIKCWAYEWVKLHLHSSHPLMGREGIISSTTQRSKISSYTQEI